MLSSPVASNEAPAVLLVRSCDGLETREDSSRLLYMNTSFSEFDKNWWEENAAAKTAAAATNCVFE